MTNKKMKSSQVKTVVVECKMKGSLETKEFEVDPEIFDDVLLEAATRFAAEHVVQPAAKIPPILTAYEKKDEKNPNKQFCYNSYYVIINAGFYRKAEIMRRNFLTVSKIDLQKEKLKGEDGSISNNDTPTTNA